MAWTTRSTPVDPRGEELWALDMPEAWEDIPAWKYDIEVSIRRMRIRDVIGAGTTVGERGLGLAVPESPDERRGARQQPRLRLQPAGDLGHRAGEHALHRLR